MVTTITRTIGPTGRDYATFTLAEAAVENIGGSADLVFENERIVFEADAGTYTAGLNAGSSLVTDATRNVTYKPADGSEHSGLAGAGVIIDTGGAGSPITLSDGFTVVDGFNLVTTTTYCAWIDGSGTVVRNCIASASNVGFLVYGGASDAPNILENCVGRDGSGHAFLVLGGGPQSVDTHARVVNCTGSSTGNDAFRTQATASGTSATAEYINCLSISSPTHQTIGSFATATGSNNFGGSTNPFPVAIQGSPYPITPTTSFSTPLSSGDYAVYMGATGALADVTGNDVWQQGVGPGSNSDVPTTDINGVARSGASCNPGAFEADGFVAPTVITKTIGPSGRDYATFTLAEAAVTSIGTGTDLTFENEAIVFEADAGDYSETLNFDTSGGLTCDATRNVTWTHAAGAGHGGQFEAGANLVGGCAIREDHAVVDGLSVSPSSGGAAGIFSAPEGVFLRNMMVYSPNSYAIRLDRGATATFPGVVENCVAKSGTAAPFDIRSEASGLDAHWRVVNCTAMATGTKQGFHVGLSSSDTLHLNLVNNNVNGGTVRSYFGFPGPTIVVTGSNNFGPDDGSAPFPVAIQGSPYPITATTNTSPGPGDFAIYDAATGALIDSPENDVLDQGVGPAVNSDVPTTDILGVTRSGATADPGAFEIVAVVPPTDGLPFPSGIRGAALRGLGIRGLAIRGRHLRGPSRQE